MKLSIFTIVLTLVSGTFSASSKFNLTFFEPRTSILISTFSLSVPSRFRLRTILSDAKLVGSVLDYQMCLMTSGLFLAHILLGTSLM